MLNVALQYFRRGWSVIPIRPSGKEPLIPWQEFQKRKASESEIRSWWAKWPNANVGIVTGAISGLAVVDLDGTEGIKQAQTLRLSSGCVSSTGKGKHLYFKHPGENVCNSVRKFPGVDLRGDGGYVLAPPSLHPNGRRYQWGVASNCAMLPIFPTKVFSGSSLTRPTQQQGNPSGWIATAISQMKLGNIDNTLFRVCSKLRRDGFTEEDALVLLKPHADRAGATENHLADKIRNVWGRYETQKEESKESAIVVPANIIEQHRKLRAESAKRTSPELPLGLLSIDTYTGGLRRGEIFTLAARTGIGKTCAAINIAINILKHKKRILFFTTEMSTDSILDRFITMLDKDEDEAYKKVSEFGTNLQICDMGAPSIDKVKAMAEETLPDVIIFDHIQHIRGRHDSPRQNIDEFVRGLKDVARGSSCAVLVLSQIRRLFRDNKTKEEVAPLLSDLKESGTIEEESGAVVLLSVMDSDDHSITLVADIAKNRYGNTTKIGLLFDKSNLRIREI